jgi:hypothetical protein
VECNEPPRSHKRLAGALKDYFCFHLRFLNSLALFMSVTYLLLRINSQHSHKRLEAGWRDRERDGIVYVFSSFIKMSYNVIISDFDDEGCVSR